MNAGVAYFQFGGDVPGGHPARRHCTKFVPVQNQPLAAKVIGAALRLELGVGGGCTLTATDGFLFRQDRQQTDDYFTEHTSGVDVLLRETLPLHTIIGQFAKVLQRVGSAFSRKSVECPKKAEIIPLFVSVLEQTLKGSPVGIAPGLLVNVFTGDDPTLLLAELPQLQKLVFSVLPLVLRAHSGVQGNPHALYYKLLCTGLAISVTGKFQCGGVPAYVDSVRMDAFLELLLGTDGAAARHMPNERPGEF